jgi:glycosidase
VIGTTRSCFSRRFILILAFVLAFATSGAQAYSSTAVQNKVDFTSDVIYQIIVDRFVDGDNTNNPSGSAFSPGCTQLKLYCGGDWQGIINKISDGYLTGMGVTAIWISVPVENITAVINYSGTNSTSYHGYWPRDMKKPNTAFGNMTKFGELITAAHNANMKVVIDFVPNHSSPADPANVGFAENGALYDNGSFVASYNMDPSNRFLHNGGTDFSTIENGIYKNLFDLADLNHNNSTIDNYLKTAIKLWLDTGIDGVRVDAVKHMPFGWQKAWMETIYSYKPVFTFGEWFLSKNEVDSRNHHFANESGMSLLDFRFGQLTRQVFRDNEKNMNDLNAMIASTAVDYAEVNDQVTFIDNHDMDRFHTVGGSNRRTEQALAFALGSRGTPAIYYGTEQYMTGNGDPANRAKMTSFSTSTAAYGLIQKMASLRKNNPALAFGSQTQRWINNDVYIFERKFHGSAVVMAINKNLSTSYSISGLVTSLPCNGASPKTYTDVLLNGFAGNSIVQNCGGGVNTFTLGAGAIAVWAFKDTAFSTVPKIGHVGPMMGIATKEITISGTNFGAVKGTVSFGATVVSGANITMWEDTLIKAKVPAIVAGKYGIKVTKAGVDSAVANNFEVLSGPQVTVRFVVNNATTVSGENIYLIGSTHEIGNWAPVAAIGPMYNQIVHQYPTWYFDVSVPAGAALQFKFLRKNYGTGFMNWESGGNHTYTAPSSATGVGTVTVNINGWDPAIPVQ